MWFLLLFIIVKRSPCPLLYSQFREQVNSTRMVLSPPVARAEQHPLIRPGRYILPTRMGYCSNTNWARRFRCGDNNANFVHAQPHFYGVRHSLTTAKKFLESVFKAIKAGSILTSEKLVDAWLQILDIWIGITTATAWSENLISWIQGIQKFKAFLTTRLASHAKSELQNKTNIFRTAEVWQLSRLTKGSNLV